MLHFSVAYKFLKSVINFYDVIPIINFRIFVLFSRSQAESTSLQTQRKVLSPFCYTVEHCSQPVSLNFWKLFGLHRLPVCTFSMPASSVIHQVQYLPQIRKFSNHLSTAGHAGCLDFFQTLKVWTVTRSIWFQRNQGEHNVFNPKILVLELNIS